MTIKARHIAMVNPQNIEVELSENMMKKWIGSREIYNFKKESENETLVEVVVYTDEVFEELMDAWPKALQLFKAICED